MAPFPGMPRTAATSFALSLALLAPLPPAAGQVAAKDRVTRHDLPTVVQVGRVYDGLDGGRRELVPWRETMVRGESCAGFLVGQEAASGREATYLGRRGGSLYRRRLEDPTVLVQRFSEKSEAESVHTAMGLADAACEGDYEAGDVSGSLRLLADPDLGVDAIYAYREHIVRKNKDYRRVVTVTREGRYLVQVETRCRDCSPARSKVVRTTRKTLDRIF